MPEFVPLLALGLVVKTAMDILRYLRGRDWNGAGSLLIVWLGGFGAAVLFAATDFADSIVVGDMSLGNLNAASLVVFGLVIGSVAANGNELLGAIDQNRSTAKPHLIDDSPKT
jgi:succinate dehydrogenase/fumarate reductase flavoprotein subunit